MATGDKTGDTSTPTPTILDIARAKMHILADKSTSYKITIGQAQTRAKKNYYQKKLEANNKELAELIIKVDEYEKIHGDTSGKETELK